ncbi:MAG TPA: flagellar basal body P-ring protein FlgI [Tepidisphaeraceae bacterium]|jgi:flagellar basal body P-ring protein FlgI|nr:flagellar basal body P-ring protein FlgI [Tepidisphaeraceae bacterium]
MRQSLFLSLSVKFGLFIGCAVPAGAMLTGCADEPKKPVSLAKQYDVIAAKTGLPNYMRRTIFEKVDLANAEAFQVSGYGLVVNLDNTGDSTAPLPVTQYMIKEMVKHGYGSKLNPGWENQSPERVLHDKRVAIVQVVGMLPPGIRKGQTFDVIVQALPKNQTSSLAGGELYLTDLKINGADPQDPFGKVNDYAQCKGFIFVNPAYALNKDIKKTTQISQSLRNGIIMDGGVVKFDRPLFLRLRSPENRMSRYIEQRIMDRFGDTHVAAAHDAGVIQIYVPFSYRGDWRHFSKLVMHLYLDNSAENLARQAKLLAVEAQKPDALLEDISYCFEGIGPIALPALAPLVTDRRPEVAFAAARAAASIGDPSGASAMALMAMARDSQNPFQLNAVEALGGLPPAAAVNHMLRELLDHDKALVRIAAYKVLAANHDPLVVSRVVTERADNQKFVLDVVPSKGPPIVYASRTGMPRIALIGAVPEVRTPMMFSAMDDRLTISSAEVGQTLMIYYRAPAPTDSSGRVHDVRMLGPVKMASNPDLSELVQRLGGICNEGEDPLDFSYSEIIAILQRLHDEKKIVAMVDGLPAPAAFMLENPPAMQSTIYNAPSIESGRPQGDDKSAIGQNINPASGR